MNFRRHYNRSKHPHPLLRAASGLAIAAIVALTILMVSPDAHGWIHADAAHEHADHTDPAAQPDHVCGVTLAQQGFCDTTPVQPEATASARVVELGIIVPRFVHWTAPEHWLQPAQGPPATRSH